MRILLVEDDPMIGEAVHAALKDASYATDWVTDGVRALTAFAAQPYDLVLLDLGLPGRDGLDVLAAIRAKDASAPLLSNGIVSLDPATREAAVDGHAPVPLSNREFSLLRALLVRPGAILSRRELEDRLYGWGEEVESNAVEFLIHSLRRKLGSSVIRNVRGAGWMVSRNG
ncbi:two-component system response regulator [Burkholderia lata]|uniref:winged helix-turn-helix domain-containing protein n=1 Tax=Burkholderia lata (strain ATCC 17760 / DSM 23089 / LMG 22485 / NCIMB 9086 / R18194 / 383) TaxID=482957 RepID=UPI001453A8D1|nr:winged helix-turn-helix domain-containing protein [Burkholderia lata]VWD55686.1 two-component system response regulator [Burkholderia lata]